MERRGHPNDHESPQRAEEVLAHAPRLVARGIHVCSAAVTLVRYPATTEFDTHQHDDAYLCLVTAGQYTEWTGLGRRDRARGEEITYRADSRHAVRTGPEGTSVLHVTDPNGCGWTRRPSPHAVGFLYQIAADLALLPARDDAAELHLESLLEELDSAGHADPPANWMAAARGCLRERYATTVRLTALAEEAGVHRSHFARAFRQTFGMTPGQYLVRLRVAAAVTRLRRSRQPIAMIAADTGFADQSHMGRCIRRYLGTTPGTRR